MKINKTEQIVLDVINGKKHYSELYRNGKRMKRADAAIDKLISRGIIYKRDDDNVLVMR